MAPERVTAARRAAWGILVIVAWLACPPLGVGIVPGLVIADRFGPWREHTDVLSWLGGRVILSFAYWSVAIWITAYTPLTLSALFHTTAVLALVALVRRPPSPPDLGRCAMARLVVVVVLAFVPFATRVAFDRGDMTMHAYYAELLRLHDGIPMTHEPLLAIPTFGEYALGFHGIAALVAEHASLPVHRAALLVACASFFAGFAAFLLALPRRFTPGAAFLGVFAFFFLSHYPLFLMQWGGAPTMLSIALALPLFPLLSRARELSRADRWITGLLAASSALVHSVPPFAVVLFAPIYVLVVRGLPGRRDVIALAWILVAALLLYAGQALRLPGRPEPEWVEWARVWNLSQLDAVQPLVGKLFGTDGVTWRNVPFAYVFIFGPLSVGLSVLAAFLSRERRARVLFLTFGVTSWLVLLSKLAPHVPMGYAFYPERVLVFMGVPITWLLAELAARLPARASVAVVVACLVSFAATSAVLARQPFQSYYRLFKDGVIGAPGLLAFNVAGGDYAAYAWDDVNSGVGPDAIETLEWVRDHLPRDEVLDGDVAAGIHLVPVIAGNKILEPHYQHFWYERYMAPWQASQNVRFFLTSGAPPVDAHEWQERFRSGSVAVYERVDDPPSASR